MDTTSSGHRRVARRSLAAAAIALGASHLAACGAGDRRLSGRCPQGERCSNAIPDGLRFSGPDFRPGPNIWGGVPTLAAGGSARIELSAGGRDLLVPFVARTSGTAIEASPLGGNAVRVAGLTPGSGFLRILAASDGLLLDRYEMRVRAIERLRLERRDRGPLVQLRAPTPTLVTTPGTASFTITLLNGSEPLVDSGLIVEVPAGSGFIVEQTFWNSFTLRAPIVRTVPLTIYHGGGSVRRFDLRVTEGTGEIAALPAGAATRSLDVTDPIPFPEGTYCFGLMLDGTRVTPEAWTFRATGGHRSLTPEANCVTVGIPYEDGGGDVVLEVSVDTLSQEFVLTPSH
jgi:hypothetical protein